MSDTTDEMEFLSGELEIYLERKESQAFLSKGCDCANGIHDGKMIDCACKVCHY